MEPIAVDEDYTAWWLRNASKEEYWDLIRVLKPRTSWEGFEVIWDEWCALKEFKKVH